MTSIGEIHGGTLANREAGTDGRGQRQVEFRFYRMEAGTVWVVGEFTSWQAGRLAMDRRDDGWWALTVTLEPGDYRFRYLADEGGRDVWYTDFASHGVEYAGGQWNSVVTVPKGRVNRAAAAGSRAKQMERERTTNSAHAETLAA